MNLRYMIFIYIQLQGRISLVVVMFFQSPLYLHRWGTALLLIEHFVAPSPVHGLGVFSTHFVPQGAKVWAAHPVIDREISKRELEDLPPHVVSLIETHSEFLPAKNIFRLSADGGYYMNHSDDPNLADQGDEMFASQNIHPGDELFCDYRIAKVMAFDPDLITAANGK